MRWVVLLIFNFLMGNLVAQVLDTLRIDCGINLALIIPVDHRDTLYNYEEGFFRTFFWKNGDILDIQCGSMSDPAYLSDSVRYEKIHTLNTKESIIQTGVERATGKYWGVVRLKKYRVVVSYICSSKRRSFFEKFLQSI